MVIATLTFVHKTASARGMRAVHSEVGQFTFTNPLSQRNITVHYVRSAAYRQESPPVVVFHGVLRNAAVYRDVWVRLAERHGLFVLVPHFSKEDFPLVTGYNLGVSHWFSAKPLRLYHL